MGLLFALFNWIAIKWRGWLLFRKYAVYEVTYREYLDSSEWKAKAAFMKKEFPWCFVCLFDYEERSDHLETNHATYKRLGHERRLDLFNVCSLHHRKGRFTRLMGWHDRIRYHSKKLASQCVRSKWTYVGLLLIVGRIVAWHYTGI